MKRLEELGRRYGVPPAGLEALRAILALQAEDPAASTTVRAIDAAVDRHVADSLVALDLPAVRASSVRSPTSARARAGPASRWRPPCPAPGWRWSRARCATAGTSSARWPSGDSRTPTWSTRARRSGPAGLGAHDLVTARALAALPVLCEYAAPLLADGGLLVAWKGAVDEDETAAGAAAAELLGLEPAVVLPVQPYPAAERRTLHVFRKVAPTPERFPRRPGMAVKRPLGSGERRL